MHEGRSFMLNHLLSSCNMDKFSVRLLPVTKSAVAHGQDLQLLQ